MKFEKTYLSREMTRAMASHGMPIGDPTGGPAYGERRDPVSAIMAVGSMYASGVGAAIVGGTLAAVTVAEGLMFAGGALSLVGNISGNKNLMVLGGALALGGGIGGLMSGAETGFNQTFSEAFTPTPGAESSLVNSPVSSDLAPGAQNVGTQNPIAEPQGGFDSTASRFETSSPASAQSINTPTPAMDGQSYLPPSAAPAAPAAPGPYVTENVLPLTPEQLKGSTGNTFGQGPNGPPVDPGIINKAMAFAKENPMAAMVLGQAAGGVATGVMDMATGKTAAQTQQLTADAAYRQSIADKTNKDSALQASRIAQINANLKASYPQINVNSNAVTLGQAKPAGIINTARG